jgi:polar amino acid transport system substrate-binding protein
MKKVIINSILILLLLFCTGCTRNENKLVMVTEAGFAPYEFYDNGKVVGVDVEIAKQIAESLGKELVIKDIAFDSIINELKSGKADFAAAGMSITEERKKEVDFTIEYTISNQVVVVNKYSDITSFDQLNGKRISVQLGSVGDGYATENYKNATIDRQKKFLVAAEAVKNNKSDCIIMDELPAQQLVEKNPELKILDGILFQDTYGMAVKKGNEELLNNINEVLQELMDNGKIDEYILKYTE